MGSCYFRCTTSATMKRFQNFKDYDEHTKSAIQFAESKEEKSSTGIFFWKSTVSLMSFNYLLLASLYAHHLELLEYRKVASSRPVYYSILNSFGQRSQYISIIFSLINSLKILKCATNQESLLLATLRYVD